MSQLRHTSSADRTLEERDLSVMRPARENAPRQRKPSVLREVTNGIVCFCGERFGEHQALEFMLHLRAEFGEILDQRARRLEQLRRLNARRSGDPAYQRPRTQRQRERYQNEPEYRQRKLDHTSARWRERYATDPEFREREKRKQREKRERRKARESVSS